MKSRHMARETALQILYQFDGTAQSVEAQNISIDLTRYYQHFAVSEPLREFIGQLVAGTLCNIKNIDGILEKHASNWKLSRMSAIDRNLLRMATYEMVILKDVHPSVIIDEAIELAKNFGTEDTPGFVNGILDSINNAAA